MSEDGEQSEVQDYGEILNTPIDGQLPLVVGGQAVNLWALLHRNRLETELKQRHLLPLTSKDLDLYGNHHLLAELKRRFGGSVLMSPERSRVIGKLQIELRGKLRNIEVLGKVRGMTEEDLENDHVEVEFEGLRIRIPLPPVILKAKLANVSQIEQTDRNDVRHVRIMILVIREYISGILGVIEAGAMNPRLGVGVLEEVLEIRSSYDANRCRELHGIDFSEIWPKEILEGATSQPIVNFMKHRLPQTDR